MCAAIREIAALTAQKKGAPDASTIEKIWNSACGVISQVVQSGKVCFLSLANPLLIWLDTLLLHFRHVLSLTLVHLLSMQNPCILVLLVPRARRLLYLKSILSFLQTLALKSKTLLVTRPLFLPQTSALLLLVAMLVLDEMLLILVSNCFSKLWQKKYEVRLNPIMLICDFFLSSFLIFHFLVA